MKWVVGLMILLSTMSAQAEDLSGRWGVGLGAGMTAVSGPSSAKDALDGGFAGSFWVRYHTSTRLALELAYTRLMFDYSSDIPGFDDWEPTDDMVDLSVAYRAWPTNPFHLLLQAGIGYVRMTDFNPLDRDDNMDDVAFKGRIGAEYMAMSNLAVALHGDYYFINMGSGTDSNLQVWAPMLAVTYYFGGGGSSSSPDGDGDGIADVADKCPGTQAGVKVDVTGCPAKMDADGDGVADGTDQCPGSPSGEPVNEFGCAKTEKLEFTLNVKFAPGSTNIDTKFTEDLQKFADFLAQYPNTKAEIEGHTDNTGGEKLNYSISQKRADSVRKYMINKLKVDKTRLTAKGFGPSQPVGDNATAEGREKNRRVVAHVKTDK